MIPQKIQKWLDNDIFPQRILLSGNGDLGNLALHISSELQGCSVEEIEKGTQLDTIVFKDSGKSFKIAFSDSAKKDGQGEYENVRGMIKWANQKPISPRRIIILENFDRVWREANHALLKLLEEPPDRAVFIFTTRNYHKIIDTIISRMTVVRVNNKDADFEITDEVREFLEGKNLINKFQQIADLESLAKKNPDKKINRKVFLEFLENCVHHIHLFNEFSGELETILETFTAIESNQNPKFSLERLAIKLTNR